LSPELRALMGYSKGGYVLGFFSDPESMNGELESVSPEKLFGSVEDRFSEIESATNLVIESSTNKV